MAKSDRTKAALADALEQLLLEQPLEKIRIRSITDKVGVDRQTFYYHFDTLSDLSMFLYHSRIDPLLGRLPRCRNAHEMFSQMAVAIDAHRGMMRGLLATMGRPALREILQDDAKAVLMAQAQRIADSRSMRPDAEELDFAVSYCLMASASMLVDWLQDDAAFTAQDLADRLAASFDQHICGMLDHPAPGGA